MKEIIKLVDDTNITFLIGTDRCDNYNIIEISNPNDLWFHANDVPSCHVIAVVPPSVNKCTKRKVITQGCLLCKQNTNTLKRVSTQIDFVISSVDNLIKIEEHIGAVMFKDESRVSYVSI
jgi:hypothetical protein